MTIKVLTYADYLTTPTYSKSDDYAACQFVKCIKNEPFNGYTRIVASGKAVRLEKGDRTKAIQAFAALVGDEVEIQGPYIFIPIPSSKTHIGSPTPSPVLDIAIAIAERFASIPGVSAIDILAWDAPMASAHKQGGSRHPGDLFPHLRARKSIPKGSKVILIDDVKTSGGHIQACAAFLECEFGAKIKGAFCLGRTVEAASDQPLAWQEHTLTNYLPF